MPGARYASLLGALFTFAVAAPARADGAMVVRDRELFREGPAERGYCNPDGGGAPDECDRVLTKVLSGYSYARGHLVGGLATTTALTALQINVAETALPGGDAKLGSVDAVLGDPEARRLRVTLLDAQELFFCRDAQSGALVLPMLGMFTRKCMPDALLAIDLGVLAMQWDLPSHRVLGEWLRLGPSVELLSNGFGYAHLLRSIELGVPFDVRSVYDRELNAHAETSMGIGLRVSAFYRSPHWETRLTARHRTALLGGAGFLADNSVECELLLLHNFFLSDALVMQAGLALRASASQEPARTFAVWANAERHVSTFAGIHLGWAHEAPDI